MGTTSKIKVTKIKFGWNVMVNILLMMKAWAQSNISQQPRDFLQNTSLTKGEPATKVQSWPSSSKMPNLTNCCISNVVLGPKILVTAKGIVLASTIWNYSSSVTKLPRPSPSRSDLF